VPRSSFRFAVVLSLAMALVMLVMAWVYDLPIRDPDGVAGPTYVRLPLILLLAFLVDVLPRMVWRSRRSPRTLVSHFRGIVRERWTWEHTRFAFVGLAAWYLTYVAFRNLKSFVPFVNRHLWDTSLDRIDRALWLGHDPAKVLHEWFGEGLAAHVFSFVYVAWIVFIPFSLIIALVWSRNAQAGAWYVTAIAVDWVLGAATYFAVPTLGPVYSRPEVFSGLSHTMNSDIVHQLMEDRHDVLVNPFTTSSVQTIAAFASLHVGMMVTVVVFAELQRFPRILRLALWLFLAITVVTTVYLGWHYFVDTIAGAALGYAGVAIAARGTGNTMRRRPLGQPAAIALDSSPAYDSASPSA
jgi:membrane-associated phospholipid phosphatase